jgi:catechol 2,3-dioxygenase
MGQTVTSAHVLPADTILGPASLIVADIDRSVSFYRDTLGFRILQREGETAKLGAGEDEASILELTALGGAHRKPRRTTGLYHVAVLTPSRDALARSLYHLAVSRYPLQGASDHIVSGRSPQLIRRNGLEIYRDRPRENWYDGAGQFQMGTLPLDLDTMLEEGASSKVKRPWTGLDAGTRVGHIHLQVAELAAAVRFYTEGLGFETMVHMPEMGAAFVSAGGYHHHIGLNTWTSRGAPPPPADAAGLRVFEIAVQIARRSTRSQRASPRQAPSKTANALETRGPSGNLAGLVSNLSTHWETQQACEAHQAHHGQARMRLAGQDERSEFTMMRKVVSQPFADPIQGRPLPVTVPVWASLTRPISSSAGGVGSQRDHQASQGVAAPASDA